MHKFSPSVHYLFVKLFLLAFAKHFGPFPPSIFISDCNQMSSENVPSLFLQILLCKWASVVLDARLDCFIVCIFAAFLSLLQRFNFFLGKKHLCYFIFLFFLRVPVVMHPSTRCMMQKRSSWQGIVLPSFIVLLLLQLF